MINTRYLLYISTCLLISGNVQASDIKLTYDSSDIFSHGLALHTQIHTPYELKPIPLSNPDNSVKLASVCSVNGGGSCGILSFNSMDLDDDFQCKDEGYVKVCPDGQIPDESALCPYNKSYFKCRDAIDECDEGYSATECSDEQVKETSYQNEAGNTCYKCRDKTCAEGGYSDSITSCQKGTEISFANKTCYQDVSDKTCEDGGYSASCPTNQEGTPVSYCGKSCYSGCKQPSCEDGGYFKEPPTNNVCKDITYYGQTCKTDCKQPDCSDGGYKKEPPTNQVCTPVSYYGTKCFDNCYQPTCDNGGFLDAQPDGKTCAKTEYYGRNCYKDCVENTCSVENCKECADDSNTKCKICEDNYELDEYYGTCYEDGYQTCCAKTYDSHVSLTGLYKQSTNKFQGCGMLSTFGPCGNYCVTPACSSFTGTFSPTKGNISQCDTLKSTSHLNTNRYFFTGQAFEVLTKDLNCSSIDVDYSNSSYGVVLTSPAYWSGTQKPSQTYFNEQTGNRPGELYNQPKKPNTVNVTVKSYTTPVSPSDSMISSFINVNLTATDKIVLSRGASLSNSVLTAPEIHIKGSVTLINSTIIADNIYIYSDASISAYYLEEALYIWWQEHNGVTQDSYRCSSTTYTDSSLIKESFIGSLNRPAAFHRVNDDTFHTIKDENEFNYSPIGNYLSNLTIYGYNAEEEPIFSEAVIVPTTDYHASGSVQMFNITVNDISGKGKSNLFYRFHTAKPDNNTFSSGKLTYVGDINNRSKTFYEQIKNNSYFSASDSCELGTAKDMVEYQELNYDNVTCKLYGLREKDDQDVAEYNNYCSASSEGYDEEMCSYTAFICQKNQQLYQESGQKLECYDCKVRYCIDHSFDEDYKGQTNIECSQYILDSYSYSGNKDMGPLCIKASSSETPEEACKRLEDVVLLEHDGIITSTPNQSFPTDEGACVVCETDFSKWN